MSLHICLKNITFVQINTQRDSNLAKWEISYYMTKSFVLLSKLLKSIKSLPEWPEQVNRELADTQPLFLSILNGSFMFTSDLIKQIVIPGTQISFVKVASYSGTCSTGAIQELIGLKEDIQNRTVVILEDIIDSGRSMKHLLEYYMLRIRNK